MIQFKDVPYLRPDMDALGGSWGGYFRPGFGGQL